MIANEVMIWLCDYCDLDTHVFNRQWNLQRHLMTVHGIKEPKAHEIAQTSRWLRSGFISHKMAEVFKEVSTGML